MENKLCTVAILNYNGVDWLQKFLPIVEKLSTEAKILVYDNASTDGSSAYVENHHPEVVLKVGQENLGFCGGYNAAFKQIDTPYTVLLNSDVEVTEGWLLPLLTTLEESPKVAAVQPKILSYHQRNHFEYAGAAGGFIDAFGYPFCRGRLFETLEKDEGQYNNACDIFWASGACVMVRTALYNELGGFDERFFAHMEEIDLCWRAQRAGYRIRVEPKSVVYHVGGGTLAYASNRKMLLNYRNNLLLLANNLEGWDYFWVLAIRLLLDGLAAIYGLSKGHWAAPAIILQAHIEFYKMPRSTIKKAPAKKVPLSKVCLVLSYFILGKKKFTEMSL